MKITPIGDVLTAAGFGEPVLNALIPDETNYTVLLMQPHGQIEASPRGVRNRDRELARSQFGAFLDQAEKTQADLVITPEYSMPWEVLARVLKEERGPALGKLWTLGCESLKYSELETLKNDLADVATLLYEEMGGNPDRFTDPLAYVFLASSREGNDEARMVVLVQFKTYPMGDNDHFEANGLQRGTCIYQFGGVGNKLKLVSLICSDAFAFLDADALVVYDRALVIHIQLNPKPRQEQFRSYRDRLLRFQGDETELICLNWAKDVEEWCGERQKAWRNISASGWYLKPDKFDQRDATLSANHRRGLYYTWLKPLYSHALFFNYKPATYLLQATKVAHIGVPAAISRRRGPQLTKTCVWSEASIAWVQQDAADDGFASIIAESGDAKDDLMRISEGNPLEAERVLALCAGEIEANDDWHNVRSLDSCIIDVSEIVRRITFSQDTDERASKFRLARLKRCGSLWKILRTDEQLPPSLGDFKRGFRFEWSPNFPHQNAVSATEQRATVIYLGEEATTAEIEAIAKRVAEFLHRSASSPDESRLIRQRLAVWFRTNGNISLFDSHRYVMIDQTGHTSEFDIGREA